MEETQESLNMSLNGCYILFEEYLQGKLLYHEIFPRNRLIRFEESLRGSTWKHLE